MANTTFVIDGEPVTAKNKQAAIAKFSKTDFDSITELGDNQLVHCDSIWPADNPSWVYCPTCGKKLS